MLKFDIILIGGGILTYATAFAILTKEPAAAICIIGGKSRNNLATTAAGAMLGCYGEVTQKVIKTVPGKIKHKMSVLASQMWPQWIDQVNEMARKVDNDCEKLSIISGTCVILNAKSGKIDDTNFSAILQTLNEDKEPYDEVEPSSIPGFNPLDDCRPFRAIYLPREGAIDPNNVLSSLKKIVAAAKNCRIFEEDAARLCVGTSQFSHVETDQGNIIQGNQCILAAGAYSQQLINQTSLHHSIPPIFSGLGVSLLVEQTCPSIPYTIRTPNRAGACGLHALPRNLSTLYIGATNNLYPSPANAPKLGHLNFLLQCAIEQINQDLFKSSLLSYSVGNRPATFDTFPLVGKTSIDGLWVLSGTYRDGFYLSPVLAELIASDILNRQCAISIPYHIFRPERHPLQIMTKNESILDAVNEYMSGAYEHGIKLPGLGWNKLLEEMIYEKIRIIYEKLETDVPIPVEIILMLDEARELPVLKNYLDYLSNHKQETLAVA